MKKIATIIALLVLSGVVAFADNIKYEPADSSPALRIKNGGTEAVTINIYAGDNATNSVTIGSTVNTLDFSGAGADTIVEIAEDIAACTNSAGVKVLTVDANCSLAADSTDDELLDAQAVSIAAGAWGEIVWDTSVALHYDVYIPSQAFDNTRGALTIDNIYGSVLGTGDVTLQVYIDRTLAWDKILAEPSTVSATNDAVLVVSNEVDLPIDVKIPLKASQSAFIRATRATTATTGLLGVNIGQ